jgi:hypothetical protein
LRLGRAHWRVKLNVAKRLWRNMRPNESQGSGRVTRTDFSFNSTRTLGANMNFSEWISGWQMDDDSWSLRVRGRLYDTRVSTMRSHAVGRDMSGFGFLDFDVLAASSLMDGQSAPPSPLVSIEASEAEVARHLADFCLRADRIWAPFGGISADTLPTLALWMIRNRNANGAGDADLSMVCAAHVYGETELGLDLLTEYETELKRRMQMERSEYIEEFGLDIPGYVYLVPSREQIAEIATANLADAAKLRRMIEGGYDA